jgi:hypothetical protein
MEVLILRKLRMRFWASVDNAQLRRSRRFQRKSWDEK